jgi:NADH:ubiquinone oxidoreductase subunit K
MKLAEIGGVVLYLVVFAVAIVTSLVYLAIWVYVHKLKRDEQIADEFRHNLFKEDHGIKR